MVALRLCSLLLLWVSACTGQKTAAEAVAEIFKKLYVDYPPTTNLLIDDYCNHMMKERELTDRKSNTFIHAPYEDIEAACNSNVEEQAVLHLIGKNVTAIMCAAQKQLPYQSYDDYCIRFLYPDPDVLCKDGLPDRPNRLVMGFFDESE